MEYCPGTDMTIFEPPFSRGTATSIAPREARSGLLPTGTFEIATNEATLAELPQRRTNANILSSANQTTVDTALEAKTVNKSLNTATIRNAKDVDPRVDIGEATKQARLAPVPGAQYIDIATTWDGVVEEVDSGDSSFTARITAQSADDTELYITVPLKKVDDWDVPLVRPGALFYVVTGHIPIRVGERRIQRLQASELRFRRLPVVRRAELQRRLEIAREKSQRLTEEWRAEG
jgi:hypothetical protein